MVEWRDGQGDRDLRIDRVEHRDARVVVVLSWAEKGGKRHEWTHLLRLRGGLIIDIQDCASGGAKALRALSRPVTWPLSQRDERAHRLLDGASGPGPGLTSTARGSAAGARLTKLGLPAVDGAGSRDLRSHRPARRLRYYRLRPAAAGNSRAG